MKVVQNQGSLSEINIVKADQSRNHGFLVKVEH